MADNSQVVPGSGDTLRTVDKSGVKTQVATLDVGGSGAEKLISTTNPLPAAIQDPNFAQSAMVDTHRGLRISEIVRLFGDSFSNGIGSGIDAGTFPNFVTIADTGTGGIGSGRLFFRTGSSNAAASATLQSIKILTHLSGALAGFQSGINFPTTPATWSIVSRKDGVDTKVASGSFNGITVPALPDGNFHRYEVWYQGAGSAKFFVDGVLLHSLSGQPATVRTSTLDFPIRYELVNDASNTTARAGMFDAVNGYFFEAIYTAADLTMQVRAASALRLGPSQLDTGIVPQLALNAALESGGNLVQLLARQNDLIDIMIGIRAELRILNLNLCTGLNVKDDSDYARTDSSFLI